MMDQDRTRAVRLADEHVVSAQQAHENLPPEVLAATNFFAITEDFFASRRLATDWLAVRPAATATDPTMTAQVIDLICSNQLWGLLDDNEELASAWQQRTEALIAFRDLASVDPNRDLMLIELLRMHQRHALDTDLMLESRPFLMARTAALSWRAVRLTTRWASSRGLQAIGWWGDSSESETRRGFRSQDSSR